jgi:hypothetical protein
MGYNTYVLPPACKNVNPLFLLCTDDNGGTFTPFASSLRRWDDFRCGGVNESNIHKVANAFIKYGLDKVGYQ